MTFVPPGRCVPGGTPWLRPRRRLPRHNPGIGRTGPSTNPLRQSLSRLQARLRAVAASGDPRRTASSGSRRVAGLNALPPLSWSTVTGWAQCEVRRLLIALVWTTPTQPGLVLAWSRWRRRHQARARRAHYQRREQQLRLEY
jgi:hypothetical protein